ncbi:hypothetical protein HDU93_002433, partial [Gonapodya sp. JEL0774]
MFYKNILTWTLLVISVDFSLNPEPPATNVNNENGVKTEIKNETTGDVDGIDGDSSNEDENEGVQGEGLKRKRARSAVVDPLVSELYLDTVNRHMLDFDFEKLCSVSLSNLNVYACLVCGKYFQGRGPSSHAYLHSVHLSHHVFINLLTLRIYVLPDGYEVKERSLDDIK